MPENVNTSELVINQAEETEDNRPVMIKVDHVSMSFNMASEQMNSLKEYAVALAKRKLFFEEFKALDDVSFEVRKGDVFGIMGTNGSGKSTMLKIIAGVLEPTKGTCQVNGNIAPLIELGAGFDMDLSARENIYLNGALLGYSKQFIDENFDAIVEFAEVEKFLDMPLKNYSSGMVARIAFAIATVIVPEILVVDEVLSVGDFMFQKKCEDRITELIEQHGVTVLIVSHNNDQIARLCNKAIWIEKGHERLQGDAEMVCRIYGGLGGRTGSALSEQKVFEALRETSENKEGENRRFRSISSSSPGGLSAKMVVDSWGDKPVSTLVLAVDSTHLNAVVGNSIAGAYGAPLVSVGGESIGDPVGRLLYEKRPSSILVFDVGACAGWVTNELSALPWSPEIEIFTSVGNTAFDYSLRVYEWGSRRGIWRESTVALIPFECVPESLMCLSLLYDRGIPAFVDEGNQIFVDSSLQVIRDKQISRVLCAGPDFFSLLKDRDMGQVDISLADAAFVFDQAKKDLGDRGMLAMLAPYTPSQWPYLLSSGCCIGESSGVLLLLDQVNLDSIASGLDFLSKRKESIDGIVYLDGSASFDDVDKEMFTSALI